MRAQDIIRKKPYLIWWVKDYDALDNEAVVEAVLNGGDWEDVQNLIKVLGMQKVSKIFHTQTHRKRCNYQPKVVDYFSRYFDYYAQRNP